MTDSSSYAFAGCMNVVNLLLLLLLLLPVQLQRLDKSLVRTLDAESWLPGPRHVCIARYCTFDLEHGLTILELGSNTDLICADCILKLQPIST